MDDPQPALGAFGRYGRGGGGLMASIERRVLYQRDGPGRVRRVVHYKVRYRDPDGWAHGETFARRVDAERRRIEIEASMVSATWLDPRRGEITLVDVTGTAVQIRGVVTLDNEPKTTRSRRTIPVARSGWPGSSSISTSASASGPTTWCSPPPPADRSSGLHPDGAAARRPARRLDDITFHGLRHSFVAIPWAAGCNVREVSEWAGHNSVAFTLTRYGGLFEDGSDAAVDRLDALLAPPQSGPPAASAQALRGRTSSRGTQCCQLTAGAIQECTASHRETWRT